MPRERMIVMQILTMARARGCFAEKRHGGVYGQRGMPDCTLYVPVDYQHWAVPLLVEVKQPGETPDPLQWHRLRQLLQYGVAAMTATTVGEVADAITAIREKRHLWTSLARVMEEDAHAP